MHGPVVIGTSGWNDADWRQNFYAGVARRTGCASARDAHRHRGQRHLLPDCRTGAPSPAGARKPAGLPLRGPGQPLSDHVKRLLDPVEPIQQERERAEGLGDKLAVVLWQLPGSLPKAMDRLERALVQFDYLFK